MSKYKYVGPAGKHIRADRSPVAPGEVVELTDESYAGLKDRFVPAQDDDQANFEAERAAYEEAFAAGVKAQADKAAAEALAAAQAAEDAELEKLLAEEAAEARTAAALEAAKKAVE